MMTPVPPSPNRGQDGFGSRPLRGGELTLPMRGKRDSGVRSVCSFLASALAAACSSSAQLREVPVAHEMLVPEEERGSRA